MADLNALIAQGAQFDLPNPVDQYSKALQLQQMGQANQLNKLKMDEYTRGVAEQNAMRNVMSQPGFDVYKPEHQALLLQAAPGTAPALMEKLAQVKKEQAQTEHFGAQAEKSKSDVAYQKLTQGLNEISNMPDAASAKASIDAHIADKSITPEKGAQLKASIDATPDFLKWKTQTLTGMLEAKDRLESMDEAARIASRQAGAAPAGTINATEAAMRAPGAPPEMFVTKDSSGRPRYVVNGVEVTPDEYQSAQANVQVRPVRSFGQPETVNAMAPVAATSVNALTGNDATMQAINVERTRLEAERNRLLNLKQSKGVQEELKGVDAQLKEINTPVNLRAEGTAFIPGRGMLTAAPALTESQKEQAVLSNPNASQAEKDTAIKRIAHLTNIPEKAMSDFERILAASNLPEAQKSKLRNDWLKTHSEHAPGTVVNVNAGQKAEDIEFGKYVVDQYKEVSNRAQLAAKSLPAIDINLRTLEKGFDTGFGTETKASAASVLAALGVKDAAQYATDAQTFLANANSAVLQKQLEQKGPQTEADAQRISATGAQLGNTKEANKFVLNVAKAQLQRDIDQRKFYSDWQTEHKTFKGAEDAWASGPGSTSLFNTPALKKYIAPATAGQSEARQTGLDKIFKGKP